jgi:hypothetical protein
MQTKRIMCFENKQQKNDKRKKINETWQSSWTDSTKDAHTSTSGGVLVCRLAWWDADSSTWSSVDVDARAVITHTTHRQTNHETRIDEHVINDGNSESWCVKWYYMCPSQDQHSNMSPTTFQKMRLIRVTFDATHRNQSNKKIVPMFNWISDSCAAVTIGSNSNSVVASDDNNDDSDSETNWKVLVNEGRPVEDEKTRKQNRKLIAMSSFKQYTQ